MIGEWVDLEGFEYFSVVLQRALVRMGDPVVLKPEHDSVPIRLDPWIAEIWMLVSVPLV